MRTPTFCINAELEENWTELKQRIRSSSPDFFKKIEHLSYFELNQCGEKIQFTVWKYFNRSKYRATPFADFAAISVVDISYNGDIILEKKHKPHLLTDWDCKEKIRLDPKLRSRKSLLIKNSSLYRVDNEYRYLDFQNGVFRISAIKLFPELISILDICSRKTSYEVLLDSLVSLNNHSRRRFESLLNTLVNHGILISEDMPNIIGPDYFDRVKYKTSCEKKYIISERTIYKGSADARVLIHVPEYVDFLRSNVPVLTNPDIVDFKNKFLSKFKDEEVSLSVALDPVLGVGYGNLENSPLSNDRLVRNKEKYLKTLDYGDLHAYMLNSLYKRESIHLEGFNGLSDNSPSLLPNSFSLIYHVFNNNLVLSSAGGSHACSLIGRFTLINEEIELMAKGIADNEESANPDVIFFDIGYQAEKEIDNINRRKKIFNHELPLLTWSCLDEPLFLDDILISICNFEVVLRSKVYGKRMIPRSTSAYNYNRSDLSVYRFLCDIQNEGLKVDLNFDLERIIPKLNYYPRIYYKNIIVSPAKVKLPVDLLIQVKKENFPTASNLLNDWLIEENINYEFKIGIADQTLCFHPSVVKDLWALTHFVRSLDIKNIYLSEALLSKTTSVKDSHDNSYHSEFITNFHHSQPIYSTPPKVNGGSIPTNKEMPGSEWLYFEIYCSALSTNEILLGFIYPYLKANRTLLKKWFFVRYVDKEDHIRLRLQLRNIEYFHRMVVDMNASIKPLISSRLVTDLKIKIYERESNRYGYDRINLVETFFHLSSIYAIKAISNFRTDKDLYNKSLLYITELLNISYNTLNERSHFINIIASSFEQEFQLNTSDFKKVNQSFKSLDNTIFNRTSIASSSVTRREKFVFVKIINNTDGEVKTRLIGDLVHMHINRLFQHDQRYHEMIIYQYLQKLVNFEKATNPIK
jgi:thiopeptide-type bacteriocin biosynthesis protein